MCAEFLQLCPIPGDPVDHSPPGSSFHGILQARNMERVAIPVSRDLLTQEQNPGLLHRRESLYHLSHQGSQNQAKW